MTNRLTTLHFHPYRYFPYEKEFARRELRLVGGSIVAESSNQVAIQGALRGDMLQNLAYYGSITVGTRTSRTLQAQLENGHATLESGSKRQATRYSSHGLHEYKGKFNPQVVAFLLNYFRANKRTIVLDPFCGSGTTLVECFHRNVPAVGIDMNPLAAFISNAKLAALHSDPARLATALSHIVTTFKRRRGSQSEIRRDEATARYLASWFDVATLLDIELLRHVIETVASDYASIFLSIGSNLLREYSLQEPSDLRIRRRKSPLPRVPLIEVFSDAAGAFIETIASARAIVHHKLVKQRATCGDATAISKLTHSLSHKPPFDFVITSPPYATALPYIDTQRLSLLWLGLCTAPDIRTLDAAAIGSRESLGLKRGWEAKLAENRERLPVGIATFCAELEHNLTEQDGFRKRALPALLYRYFAEMQAMFTELRPLMAVGARLAFLVGSNHTNIGKVRREIDTPHFLADIAVQAGFHLDEVVPLQTYHRYGLHQKNAVRAESLLFFNT